MKVFTMFMTTLLVTMFFMAVAMQRAESEGYQDRYLIAHHTYENVVPKKYNKIYKDVRDRSARRTMVDAARDYCHNEVKDGRFFGPNHPTRPFDCTSF